MLKASEEEVAREKPKVAKLDTELGGLEDGKLSVGAITGTVVR